MIYLALIFVIIVLLLEKYVEKNLKLWKLI